MADPAPRITYTETDEAPALATASWLPIVRAFASRAGIDIETRDISLAGRILGNFPESTPDVISDALSELGALAKTDAANIIKLPNISASIPQLNEAIAELRQQGFRLPNFPDEPKTPEEQETRKRYAKVLGSAVNPVLREGNSDRRVAAPVKAYARKFPHSMGAWDSQSKTHVASMSDGDFFSTEQSTTMPAADELSIELETGQGRTALRDKVPVQAGEVIDASVMSCAKLREYVAREIADAREHDLLLSLHLKATMMKVSDPIIFGHVVSVFFEDLLTQHATVLDDMGFEPRNGLGELVAKLQNLPDDQRVAIEADLQAVYARQPKLAMVDSDHGITNLHVPSDVIIDASMPAAIRSSGKMWGPDGQLHDTKALIPDRCYAPVYQTTIEFCQQHGAFDVATMGNVSNVGLMAQKAEEYGSHDKTFEIPEDGTVLVCNSQGEVLMKHTVAAGDIWRMCQTKDEPIRDWVRLAVSRARATQAATIFWLNPDRPHDQQLTTKVNEYLAEHDHAGLDIRIMSPVEATRLTCQRARDGLDTVSVTGNVLRDYLTDLFPILELGTSAKMLSIVPLLAGGGLFETGAGGSAPKHVQQFVQEGHLRWDSLGEFLALAVSLEHLAEKTNNPSAQVLADTLTTATGRFLDENKSPSRKVGELDTRGSHFYLAFYWAEALAAQSQAPDLQAFFQPFAKQLAEQESTIAQQLLDAQGQSVDIGGYYYPDANKVQTAMRPSPVLNDILDQIAAR